MDQCHTQGYTTTVVNLCCSLGEADLWDYIITNETMEATRKQLEDISGRALAGQIGNGIEALQEPELIQNATAQTVCSSSCTSCQKGTQWALPHACNSWQLGHTLAARDGNHAQIYVPYVFAHSLCRGNHLDLMHALPADCLTW